MAGSRSRRTVRWRPTRFPRVSRGAHIVAGGFDRNSAIAIVSSGVADLVAFGRHFTSNPDLPYRLKHNLPLTPYVRAHFWGGTEQGYTDFQSLEDPS